jgi:predicted amidophosphoribosyltransferase
MPAHALALAPVFDLVACVPLSRSRARERGYNQAAVVAAGVAKYFEVPFAGRLLLRDEQALRQSSLRLAERRANASAAFRITAADAFARALSGKRVLLVDDIATSLSTLNACAAALKGHGAACVIGAVVASP